MATVHLLTQYIWPDAAPTGLYAEQLAARIEQRGDKVRLVGGRGGYRTLPRPRPVAGIIHLDHYQGRRGNLRQTFAEYASVTRAFRDYIGRFVRRDDLVIVTSAPPNTVTLASAIRRRGARCIYWLQDYYPELVRGLYEYPAPLRRVFRRFWDHHLARWDKVVKIGANLGGPARNSVVIRNWPTLSFDSSRAPEPRTAIYSGNLGYGQTSGSWSRRAKNCARQVTASRCARTDAVPQLPAWLQPVPLEHEPDRLRDDLLRHEVHLVAASPKIRQAIFPSKIWNSLAAGRELICTGFVGEMAEELKASKLASFATHLDQWSQLIAEAQNCEQPDRVGTMEAARA